MGCGTSFYDLDSPARFNEEVSYIKCIYEIKDYNDTQIINDRFKSNVNKEIESKIKMFINGQKGKISFKKKFDILGINVVYFVIEENLNDMSFIFNNCTSLKKINFFSVDTFQVKKMRRMFQDCHELKYLDLSNFNTKNVNDMSSMFYRCFKLKEIKGINKFNTIYVSNFENMFTECSEIEYLDLSNFNTPNLTNMLCMFSNCYKLKEIKGLNKFITTNVTNMSALFQQCHEIEYIDLSNFNTINVTDMSGMFNKCYKLKQIKGLNKFITTKVTNMFIMFQA